MVPQSEKYHPFKPFQSKHEFINNWKKYIFGGKECSLKQYLEYVYFLSRNLPFFEVGIKIDILETQLIRASEAEAHFNFRFRKVCEEHTKEDHLTPLWQMAAFTAS